MLHYQWVVDLSSSLLLNYQKVCVCVRAQQQTSTSYVKLLNGPGYVSNVDVYYIETRNTIIMERFTVVQNYEPEAPYIALSCVYIYV